MTDPEEDEDVTVSTFVAGLIVRATVGPQGDVVPFGSFSEDTLGASTIRRRPFPDLAPVRSATYRAAARAPWSGRRKLLMTPCKSW